MSDEDVEERLDEVEGFEEVFKVGKNVAMQEFYRMMVEFDIDTDVSVMDKETRVDFESKRRVIVRALKQGRLTVNDEGIPEYKTGFSESFDKPIKFKPLKGKDFRNVGSEGSDPMSDFFKLMAKQCNYQAKDFIEMDNRDLKVCKALSLLFITG